MKQSEQRRIFDEWLHQYRALLFKVITSYAFNAEDQNDLFQDICLGVYQSIPNFKAACAVSTWLYRIALNTALKWSAREKKHSDGHRELTAMPDLLQTSNQAKDERITWLYEAIRKLNEIDRSLTLLLLDGYSYREMAEIMGITESNIGVRVHRVKKQLVNQSRQFEYDEI